jgi:hypothetical protein
MKCLKSSKMHCFMFLQRANEMRQNLSFCIIFCHIALRHIYSRCMVLQLSILVFDDFHLSQGDLKSTGTS